MANNWKNIIDGLGNGITDEAKNAAKSFIDQLLTDTNAFAKRQGQKITAYFSEYASGELTADELKECIKDVALLTESHAAMESVAAKQKLQTLALNVSSILLKGVVTALV
jgi:hypothetical protein